MNPKGNCYIHPRVSKKALQSFFDAFPPEEHEIHTLQLYHRDALMLRIAPAPYSCDDKREVYSLSKSFCSTAIGFLCDDGKLSVEDRIVDLFPEKLPETVSENLSAMRLRHVLSMNTGHAACVMPQMIQSDDAVKAFLAQPIPFQPGTHFAYNTGATCLLSCIVEKVSGMKLLDFLTWRLFLPLGISNISWNQVPSGQNEGGVGIQVNSDDILKLGRLYMAGGVWNGKRLLSERWVKEATSFVSDNSANGNPDWCAGYGYQFWVNAREGFRGDGACGQLCFVLPERQMVFALQTEVGNMQREIDLLMELADHLFDEDGEQDLILPAYLPTASVQKLSGLENTYFRLEPNPMGWTGCYFRYDSETNQTQMVLSDGKSQQTLAAGNGHFAENNLILKKFKPKIVNLMSTKNPELCRFMASCQAENGKLQFFLRFRNSPHRMNLTAEAAEGKLTLRIDPPTRQDADAAQVTGFVL